MSNIFEDNNEFAPWEIGKMAKEIEENLKEKDKPRLYWRMFQDRKSVNYSSVVITQEDMIKEVEYWNNEGNEEMDAPVFEPVFMTEEEFDNLEEFKGF